MLRLITSPLLASYDLCAMDLEKRASIVMGALAAQAS